MLGLCLLYVYEIGKDLFRNDLTVAMLRVGVGDSVFGGVSAEILSDIFGEKINFTDTSHEGRKEFLNKPRTYTSFKEIAIENAYSRIPLGVHFRMDCTEGLRLGYELGKTINSIDIKSNKEVSFKN